MELFKLEVITQEKVIYQDTADSVTAPASEGEVTILAHHAPFFSKINPGEITIRKGDKKHNLVVGSGFIDVSPENKVTILVDSASRVEDIDIRQAEEARRKAEDLLQEREKLSRTEILRAEASLRKAVLELKVARRSKRHSPTFLQNQ
jgi:F-type H+-transporting ATPase subunit epsilon